MQIWQLTGFPKKKKEKSLGILFILFLILSFFLGAFLEILMISSLQMKKLAIETIQTTSFKVFRDAISDSGLHDLPMEGYKFTWSKSKGKSDAIEEKLDTMLANLDWIDMFPNFKLKNIVASKSDHSPIRLLLDANCKKPCRKHCRFKNSWLLEPSLDAIVKEGWNNGVYDDLILKLSIHGTNKSSLLLDHMLTYVSKSLNPWEKLLMKIMQKSLQLPRNNWIVWSLKRSPIGGKEQKSIGLGMVISILASSILMQQQERIWTILSL